MIVCRAQSDEASFSRWRKMVSAFPDACINVVGDSRYVIEGWNRPLIRQTSKIVEDRFNYIPLRFVSHRLWRGGFAANGLVKLIRRVKPDFLYLIGTETTDVTFQAILAKELFCPRMKIALFTMTGTDLPLRNLNFRLRWNLVSSFVDAYFCHCPKTVEILRLQGKVWQPIYMQTQVGVCTDIFKPDISKRRKIRQMFGIKDDEYLFGSVSRMDIRKGLIDMLDALPVKAKWKFIMIGSGPDQKTIEKVVYEKSLENQVILPGYIEGWESVSEFINAMDCSVLMSKTLPGHCDTFALAVAQSMAVALPVIVSNSGGLAYQVGPEGIVVREGDISGLHAAMEYISDNPEEGRKIGEKMRKRLLVSFSVNHLNRCFYYTIQDILNNKYNINHIDQQNFVFDE